MRLATALASDALESNMMTGFPGALRFRLAMMRAVDSASTANGSIMAARRELLEMLSNSTRTSFPLWPLGSTGVPFDSTSAELRISTSSASVWGAGVSVLVTDRNYQAQCGPAWLRTHRRQQVQRLGGRQVAGIATQKPGRCAGGALQSVGSEDTRAQAHNDR